METNLTWENPPSGRRAGGSSRIDAEVAQLKKRPGRWAKLRDGAPSGNYITYKKRGVVTRVSGVGNNHYDIWGVWFGTPDEAATIKAVQLEPNILIEWPGTEKQVVVRDVSELDTERVLVEVLDGKKVRRMKLTNDHEVVVMGLSTK